MELVIVVVIMGIIAAIAVPRMSSSAENAAKNAVVGSQKALQTAIDLYTAEHEGQLPHVGAGTALVFYKRLISTSDLDGTVNESTGIYGPYINGIPVNPINGLNTVRQDGVAAGADTHGWRYNTTSGVVEPDHKTDATTYKAKTESVEKVSEDLVKSFGG
ncbi:MAG: hypothetical protein HRT64_12880 [Erythrobacter sp.]|nr:hypothetical protein [Erythrobacter sp.]